MTFASALLFRHRLLRAATVRRGRQRRPAFRPPKPSGPIATYTTLLNRVVDGLNAKIVQALHHAGLAVAIRQDAPADGSGGEGDGIPMLPSQRQRALAFVDELTRNPIDRRELIGPIDDVAAQTAAFSRDQFQRLIRTAMGVDVTVGDPGLAARAAEFRTRNLALIRTLSEDHVGRVRQILDDSGVRTRNEDIAADLIAATGITKRHAALIARDQVMKYNANVTRARHEDAGITSYTWRTSEDERVREDHQVLDGQVFSYADPPVQDERTGETGNPGEGIQCRCTADPVIPGYDDDGDDDASPESDDEPAAPDDSVDTDKDTRNDGNPDQPRDERGRFGSGGSGSANPQGRQPEPAMRDQPAPPTSPAVPPQPPPPPTGGHDNGGRSDPDRSEMDPPGGIPGRPPPWHIDNAPRSPGTLDESARTEEPEARPIIEFLVAQGNHVRTLPELRGGGRNADGEVNGARTEWKRPDPGVSHGTIKNIIQDSKRGTGQARNVVIDARGTGLSRATATHGINRTRPLTNGKIDYVRVIGDGFDVTYDSFGP